MTNSKQSDDFITWLNIDGVTKWTEPALKTKLKELFDNAINQAVDEQLKDIIKLNNKVYDPIELEILLEKKLNLGGKP